MNKIINFRNTYNNIIRGSKINNVISILRTFSNSPDSIDISSSIIDYVYFTDESIEKILGSFVYSNINKTKEEIILDFKKYMLLYIYCVNTRREQIDYLNSFFNYNLIISKYSNIISIEDINMIIMDLICTLASFSSSDIISNKSVFLHDSYFNEDESDIVDEDIFSDFNSVINEICKNGAIELNLYFKFFDLDKSDFYMQRLIDNYSTACMDTITDAVFFHEHTLRHHSEEDHSIDKVSSFMDILATIVKVSGYNYDQTTNIPFLSEIIRTRIEELE